jgi:hypothetical protein
MKLQAPRSKLQRGSITQAPKVELIAFLKRHEIAYDEKYLWE